MQNYNHKPNLKSQSLRNPEEVIQTSLGMDFQTLGAAMEKSLSLISTLDGGIQRRTSSEDHNAHGETVLQIPWAKTV